MRSIRQAAVALVFLPLATTCAQQKPASPEPAPANPALRDELLRLGREDQAAREGFGPAAAANDTAYMRRLMRGDSLRTVRLREIVSASGWPGRRLVGREAAKSAWLILQHSNALDLQQALLPKLWLAADSGEVSKGEIAMLTDRVLLRSGKRQRYGTGFSLQGGRMVLDSVETLDGLDARRAAVGLPPMAEYAKKLAEVYKLPVVWPPSP
jgi:hypothetical protein